MEFITELSAMLATLVLGLMSGALVAEGSLLVPFWRTLAPGEFLSWYKQHAALLQNFFGPLEVGAAALTIAAAVLAWLGRHPAGLLLAAAAGLCLAILAVFPIYFQKANTSFRTGTIALERVGDELRRWSAWHWARTLMALAAFGVATVAVKN